MNNIAMTQVGKKIMLVCCCLLLYLCRLGAVGSELCGSRSPRLT